MIQKFKAICLYTNYFLLFFASNTPIYASEKHTVSLPAWRMPKIAPKTLTKKEYLQQLQRCARNLHTIEDRKKLEFLVSQTEQYNISEKTIIDMLYPLWKNSSEKQRALLQAPAPYRTKKGKTVYRNALQRACASGNSGFIKSLLYSKLLQHDDPETPALFLLVSGLAHKKTPARMQELLLLSMKVHGADFYQNNIYGDTIVGMAIHRHAHTALKWILEQYPDLAHKPDKHGNTPAHLAAQYGNVQCLDILQKYKCSYDTLNKKGLTPYDIAKHQAHTIRYNPRILTMLQPVHIAHKE